MDDGVSYGTAPLHRRDRSVARAVGVGQLDWDEKHGVRVHSLVFRNQLLGESCDAGFPTT